MITGIHHIAMKCYKEEYNKVIDFYVNILGLKIERTWGDDIIPDGVMINTGNSLLEIFTNKENNPETGAIRHFAFAVIEVDSIIEKVKKAGYTVFKEPKDIVIKSNPEFPARIAFCYGPMGEEIEFFLEK